MILVWLVKFRASTHSSHQHGSILINGFKKKKTLGWFFKSLEQNRSEFLVDWKVFSIRSISGQTKKIFY